MAKPGIFFVDTTVLIGHMRQKQPPTLLDKAHAAYGVPVVSEIVIFELEVGARRAGRSFEFQQNFNFLRAYPLLQAILIEAAHIQADLLNQNQVIGLPDTFIAATAMYHNWPLLSLNTKHFQRVAGLNLLPIL